MEYALGKSTHIINRLNKRKDGRELKYVLRKMINCLDGKEDGDAPEKGSNGGCRPTHTGDRCCLSNAWNSKFSLMDRSFP